MSIKLECGKKYLTRCGGVIEIDGCVHGEAAPFRCTHYRFAATGWREDGRYLRSTDHPLDLIAEYHEPAPAGWILCKDRMPTEADGLKGSTGEDEDGNVLWMTHHRGVFVTKWDAPPFDRIAWLPIPKFTPPPPEKKKIRSLLTMADIPWASLLRKKESPEEGDFPISAMSPDGVYVCGKLLGSSMAHLAFSELLNHWEISRDGGKTWEPCYKEVEA